ncbi:MAG TPA: acyl-CoA synthetase [Microbacterium sp.]|nr:acyl-CoA synthetase [Microbacterium sp.]
MPAAPLTFTARHVQLSRAVLAAVAALMITFSPDHSAAVGLSVFGGFAIATALVLVLAAILVHRGAQRWPALIMSGVSFVLGMTASIPSLRSDTLFFVVVIVWAAATGLVEVIAGIRAKGADGARDAVITGGAGLLLAVLLLVIPAGLVHEYMTPQGETMVLTGIILGVGSFGGYAAIVAVLQGIAGLTPNAKKTVQAQARTDAGVDRLAEGGPA